MDTDQTIASEAWQSAVSQPGLRPVSGLSPVTYDFFAADKLFSDTDLRGFTRI
jgi:hypothetical protein